MKTDTLLLLGGLAGIAYLVTRKPPPPVSRNPRTRVYVDPEDPESPEIGLSS